MAAYLDRVICLSSFYPILITKFYEDWKKIVDFLLMANFWTCAVFSYSDSVKFFPALIFIRTLWFPLKSLKAIRQGVCHLWFPPELLLEIYLKLIFCNSFRCLSCSKVSGNIIFQVCKGWQRLHLEIRS